MIANRRLLSWMSLLESAFLVTPLLLLAREDLDVLAWADVARWRLHRLLSLAIVADQLTFVCKMLMVRLGSGVACCVDRFLHH